MTGQPGNELSAELVAFEELSQEVIATIKELLEKTTVSLPGHASPNVSFVELKRVGEQARIILRESGMSETKKTCLLGFLCDRGKALFDGKNRELFKEIICVLYTARSNDDFDVRVEEILFERMQFPSDADPGCTSEAPAGMFCAAVEYFNSEYPVFESLLTEVVRRANVTDASLFVVTMRRWLKTNCCGSNLTYVRAAVELVRDGKPGIYCQSMRKAVEHEQSSEEKLLKQVLSESERNSHICPDFWRCLLDCYDFTIDAVLQLNRKLGRPFETSECTAILRHIGLSLQSAICA